jgi:uncharacterized caspase-like protein
MIVAVAIAVLACPPAHGSDKVALVIGNAVYRNVPALFNPGNDATDIARSFERLGFAVTRVKDATYEEMRRALLTFGRTARGAEMAVVFYAGHGIEVGGENWLIPIDAELRGDTDIDHEAVSLKGVMVTVESAGKLGLVILDACRNNPFAAKMTRSVRTRAVARGLAQVEPSGNVLVAFAAKDGTLAADGSGRNSPFTAALLKHIEQPGLEIGFLFRNVRDDVIRATNRVQQPFVYGSLSKEAIYLNPAPVALPPAALPPAADGPSPDEITWGFLRDSDNPQALKRFIEQFPDSPLRAQAEARLAALPAEPESVTPPAPAPAVPASRAPDFELAYWDSIKESTNIGEFESYLQRFPDGAFAPLARLRIEQLQRKERATHVTTTPPVAVPRGAKCFSFQGKQFCE